MPGEEKLRKQMQRGMQARRIIDDPLFREAFETIEAEIDRGWKESEGADHEARHNAYLMHRLLRNLKSHFDRMILSGNHARRELLDIAHQKKAKTGGRKNV